MGNKSVKRTRDGAWRLRRITALRCREAQLWLLILCGFESGALYFSPGLSFLLFKEPASRPNSLTFSGSGSQT